eukprot:CAMPEP_0194589098 /NCGR_PEP_ID=MMETSP0292-20121207/20344_1 /TAXON_ID=39354 /ORGANISM="Heterosigma akashiwo, Strain CCMP2393" /LENGTH=246 /DNA_ID=CAMNT_0039446069 /DNA_START=272 /DNA_END=1013 /DNA_ORIENTATION=-
MAAFRQQLIDQMNKEKEQRDEFSGYDLFDLIVDKWGVAYDIRLKKETFAGKPMLFINVLWRYLGQKSFPFKDETEYLEHLQAVAELLVKWERVDHVKEKIAECRKRPQAYFGYAVAIPLNLPVDELITLMPELFDFETGGGGSAAFLSAGAGAEGSRGAPAGLERWGKRIEGHGPHCPSGGGAELKCRVGAAEGRSWMGGGRWIWSGLIVAEFLLFNFLSQTFFLGYPVVLERGRMAFIIIINVIT